MNDEELDDDSKMPFGKYRGHPMSDVPASYFHYLWNDGLKYRTTNVSRYIKKNLDALKMEYQDGLWD